MKTLLCTALLAVFATLAPAQAQEAKMIQLDMTKYGADHNAQGQAKIVLGGEQKQTLGVLVMASGADYKEYKVVVTTTNEKSYEVATLSMYLATAVVEIGIADMPSGIDTLTDVVRISIEDEGGAILQGSFPGLWTAND